VTIHGFVHILTLVWFPIDLSSTDYFILDFLLNNVDEENFEQDVEPAPQSE
jgi:hypothetical protein